MIHVLYVAARPGNPHEIQAALGLPEDAGITTAASVQDALTLLQVQPYDAVITDEDIRDEDRRILLRQVRHSELPVPVPVWSSHEDRPQSSEHGGKGENRGKSAGDRYSIFNNFDARTVTGRMPPDIYHFGMEHATEGIVLIKDDIIIYANPAASNLMGGYPPEDIVGHRYPGFIHPGDREKIAERIRARLSLEPIQPVPFTFRVRSETGQIRSLESRGFVVLSNGHPAVLSFLSVPIDRTICEQALIPSAQKISLLNKLTRHDIANRLTVLRGRLRRIKKGITDPEILKQIEDADKAGGDIYTLLETARAYQDMGSLSPQWFSLYMLIRPERVLTDDPDLRIETPTDNLEIWADPLIPRVFENLIDNTLRHGGHITTIRLIAKEENDGLILIYEDDGRGIPEADKDRIFDQGFGENTGLGLFLSREILSITGITIRECGKTGAGARFEIRVPPGAYRPGGYENSPSDSGRQ